MSPDLRCRSRPHHSIPSSGIAHSATRNGTFRRAEPGRFFLAVAGAKAHSDDPIDLTLTFKPTKESEMVAYSPRIPGLALLALSLTASLPEASAQSYPSRPIRIVVPTSPSTPPDIISRVIAGELSDSEGWQVVVENRPGAVQTLAATDVLKQGPDGYSILVISLPLVAAPALLPNLGFHLDTDLTPVIKVSVSYNVLVANPSVPVTSVSGLVSLLKSKPDQFTFSSGGFGTPAHLIGEMFKLETGVRATHVPYQQFPQAIGDLLNGTNQYMFITMLPVVDLIKTGKLRALAVTAPKRLPALNDVPTIVEEGLPSLVVEDWIGFAVKTGTPNDVVVRLNQAVNKALATSKVRESFAKLGAEPAGGTPAEYSALYRSQLVHWAKVIKDSGIKMQQ
jgi:tripartite-type tricarboxylate transporter receptor subunit TctC